MRHFIQHAGLALSVCILAACGGGDGSAVTKTINGYTVDGGVAQKGALLKGSHVWIDELNPFAYAPTGFTYDLLTKDNQGRFDSSTINFTRPQIQTFAEGYYFNEITGALANDSVLLQAQGDLTIDRLVNVNLLTTLAGPRLVALATDKTKPSTYRKFAAARTQAQKEVLAAFWIYNSTDLLPGGVDTSNKLVPGNFSELDLSSSQSANQILAALSALAVKTGGNGVGISQFIANFQLDLADDGLINGSGNTPSVRGLIDKASSAVDMSAVAKNLNAFYGANTISTTQLNTWIDLGGGADQVVGRYKYFAASPTTNALVKSGSYVAGSEDVGQCFSFGLQVTAGATGSLYYNESTTPASGPIQVAKAGDRLVMGLTSANAGKYGGFMVRSAPVKGACPAANTVSPGGLVRVAKFSIVFYGQAIDQSFTAASVAGTSFVSSAFPFCGASADSPVKVFFDSFDVNNKGKVFIYGGTSCKSGVEAWYQDLNAGVVLIHNGANTILLAKKDANTLAFDAYYFDGNGARQPLAGGYGTMPIQAAYPTSLYQDAYWTGTVCRLPLTNTPTIGVPTIPYIRSTGFPTFDSVSNAGCPTGWLTIQVSRHRSLDLKSEENSADGAFKNYHFPITLGNWDYHFGSSKADATKDTATNTYPIACPTVGMTSLSYSSHLTMSKEGFTAAGNVCENGVPYYQFVNGRFSAATAPGAPSLTSVTGGNAQATLTFTTPASNGGATISSYTATCTAGSSSPTISGTSSPLTVTGLTNGTPYSCSVAASNSAGKGTASSAISVTPSSTVASCSQANNFPDVSLRANFIDYNADTKTTWESNANLQPKVTVSCANGVVSVASNGIPNFDSDGIGKLPTDVVAFAVNQVTWKFSQTPAVAANSTELNLLGPIGVMVNGVQIYGPNEAPPDYTADPYKAGILNFCGGHVDKYHFHSFPECFFNQKTLGGVSSFLPDKTPGVVIGYALDGFPILSPYESCTTGTTGCVNGVKEITSAYKYTGTGAYTKENAWTYNTYQANYNGSTLDQCNGKVGSNGSYAYYATRQFPYYMGCYKGTRTAQ